MAKSKHYACVYDQCPFKTDKRKAIYTHLVRTHSERKEDYECEYCTMMFEVDTEIEHHLHVQHPEQAFTYTCVSRIEKVINNCARLGEETRKSKTKSPVKANTLETTSSNDQTPTKTESKPEPTSTSPISKPPYSKPSISSSMRTRASVNASLNNIAKQPRLSHDIINDVTDYDRSSKMKIKTEHHNGEDDLQNDVDDFDADTDEESPTYISKPSGLKIKLSLKRTHSDESREISSERSSSPPVLEPNYTYQLDSNYSELPELSDDMPPDIMKTQTAMSGAASMAQVRMKDSKYYDKLEVYHRTDEYGRRCCPFCDYKTSKNTIRVHLSGIHKIHFVKCSLCDYKAAFPHQITQHGLKFHKTTNMNVIQLSKESRDKTIARLKRNGGSSTPTNSMPNSTSLSTTDNDSMLEMSGKEIIDDEDFNSEESVSSADEIETSPGVPAVDERQFKPPKCQTSKTDYYSIRIENGVYMYTCNLCSFQTPVRATIYTHKYRHEEKSYRCGYCDFTSAPRSNVVHHCRVKHKTLPVHVVENDALYQDEEGSAEKAGDKQAIGSQDLKASIKVEPLDTDASGHVTTASPNQDKSHQTIIKVPQFKRSFGSDTNTHDEKLKPSGTSPISNGVAPGVEYKLSLNKLYRVNPAGSPKFMCALCPYACDTHPKMKHHLYRHRPQKYKCPYCDHRKYPRSYVVRHVRDTHRNKPVRVIDLSKGGEAEDIPEYANDSLVDDIDEASELIDGEDGIADMDTTPDGKHDVSNDVTEDGSEEQHEEVNALKQFAQKLNLRSVLSTDLNDDIFMQSSDVSPNFSESVYTSTPLIESFISGKYPNQNQNQTQTQNQNQPKQQTKNFEKKKSLKDYRVNYGNGPRYICNICGYGTENYKTIHNHMYRHESQRYQCPYCGYRRSPRSFVENHIREVHKGHPVIVTELNVDQEMTDTPTGSPRQCVGMKRKEPGQDTINTALDVYSHVQNDTTAATKPKAKWPAPKPVSEVNVNKQAAVKVKEEVISPPEPVIEHMAESPLKNLSAISLSNAINSPVLASQLNRPIKVKQFQERNRTTFKSIYKCVFDPETCNHISKDKSKMKQHLFMHVEYKPWSCDLCDMVASQSSHIKNHVRTEHKYVPDTSFKYKKHNYLEKHIEGFLSKGLFTVPVAEYRAIMDMKGNTKCTRQTIFGRDVEGNLMCPYCPYRTKSGGMMDHVKMKHMQPRFKCHWCDFTAFYKSEVRKHHRKEKGHGGLEFKTQELDLIQVVENNKNKQGGIGGIQSIAALNTSSANTNIALDPSLYLDEEGDDVDDDVSECSSSGGSSVSDFQQGYMEYTTEQLSEMCSSKSRDMEEEESDEIMDTPLNDNPVLMGDLNTEIGPDGCMKIVQKPKINEQSDIGSATKESKFKCGYCTFSAALRVKVKMHSSKRHPSKMPNIIEPAAKREHDTMNDNADLHADDWKGTKFEQDLKRAGVSKLNLASLFPNSKRFVSPNTDNKTKVPEIKDDKFKTSLGETSSNVEFKKPLDPVVVKKVDKKLEQTVDKQAIIVEDEQNTNDKNQTAANLGNINEADVDETQELMISNVRSLNESDTKHVANDNISIINNAQNDIKSDETGFCDDKVKDEIKPVPITDANNILPQSDKNNEVETNLKADGAETKATLNENDVQKVECNEQTVECSEQKVECSDQNVECSEQNDKITVEQGGNRTDNNGVTIENKTSEESESTDENKINEDETETINNNILSCNTSVETGDNSDAKVDQTEVIDNNTTENGSIIDDDNAKEGKTEMNVIDTNDNNLAESNDNTDEIDNEKTKSVAQEKCLENGVHDSVDSPPLPDVNRSGMYALDGTLLDDQNDCVDEQIETDDTDEVVVSIKRKFRGAQENGFEKNPSTASRHGGSTEPARKKLKNANA